MREPREPSPSGPGGLPEEPHGSPPSPRPERAPGDFSVVSSGIPLGDRYEKLEIIGSGYYGKVFQARDTETDEIVALKHIHIDEDLGDGVPGTVIREISLLREFVHPNIMQLQAIQHTSPMDFNLVFEYIDSDLHKVLKSHRKAGRLMPMGDVVRYSQELLSGIHACHVRRIMHRDLKPANILVGRDGLKICDFGMARLFSVPTRPYTHDVITLWYRAPELLLGAKTYGLEVDIWSAGCIVLQMVSGLPAFPGQCEIDTVFKLLRCLGTPTEETYPGFTSLPHWRSTLPAFRPRGFGPFFEKRPECKEAGVQLVETMLIMRPDARITSRRAKNHAFFKEYADGSQ